MATTTSPWPALRTASTEHVDLQHPAPDLSISPEGTIHRNVSRLEQSAEELSQGGSDIGEEIKKLQEDQRREEHSRRSSLASQQGVNISQQTAATARSRGASTSSYANSIVDLNREARWGGYSPNAFINSPSQSINSGTWSQGLLQRSASNAMSTSTRPEPVQEGRPLDSPLASPSTFTRQPSQSSLTHSNSIQHSPQHSRRSSRASKRSSTASAYERPSNEFETAPEHVLLADTAAGGEVEQELGDNLAMEAMDTFPQDGRSYHGSDQRSVNQVDRPGSSDTYRQANILFQDFDGVHFSPTNEEFVELDEHGNEVRRIPLEAAGQALMAHPELLAPLQQRASFMHPPPPENMVYYPAPVPRMLNLPKRLSMQPSAGLVAQRKSQIMLQAPQPPRKVPSQPRIGDFGFERRPESLAPEELMVNRDGMGSPDRQSMRSASPDRLTSPTRRPQGLQTRESMATLANMPASLPPQLRASLFFDQPAARQSVHIQSESAVATLDSILQASATAPVSVFTDHPFAGALGGEVYGREKRRPKRNTMSQPLISDARNSVLTLAKATPKTERRRSLSGLLSGSKDDEGGDKLTRRNSVMSMMTDLGNPGGKKLQKRNSRLSLNSENMLDKDGMTSRPISPAPTAPFEEVEQQEEQYYDAPVDAEEDEEDDEDMGPVFAQPTTLLAELQVRKAQQKSRNRTAATAYPNGMHSTLLQLDAVAQIEEKKRKKHKITLAWEDPALRVNENEEPDEDVPLAVLFPTKSGKARKKPGESDWDRPLGLIERRHMEDNEPLSSRRNRMLGINPRAANRLGAPVSSQASLNSPRDRSGTPSNGQPSPAMVEDPDEDIPLAERRRRMMQKAALDSALGDVAKDNKSTFESDMLSVLGGPAAEASSPTAEKENVEEETLGQRRARLQREKSGLSGTAAPATGDRTALRQSMSLANLLASAPMTAPVSDRDHARRLASSPAPGTLLGDHEQRSGKAKEELRQKNARTSSYADMRGPPSSTPGGMFATDAQQGSRLEERGLLGLQQRGRNASGNMGLAQSQTMPAMSPMNGGHNMNGMYDAALAQQQQMQFQQQMQHQAALQQQQQMQALQAQMQIHALQQQMGQKGQMMNPLAFQPFVPPAPQTGMGFAGGMAAYPGQGMGGQMSYTPMGMPGMGGQGMYGMGMGMAYQPGMDDGQRTVIDQWRSSVAQ